MEKELSEPVFELSRRRLRKPTVEEWYVLTEEYTGKGGLAKFWFTIKAGLALLPTKQELSERGAFKGVDFSERVFPEGSDLKEVDFTGSRFDRAVFKGSADFTGSDLSGTSFREAQISKACMDYVRAYNANFDNAVFHGEPSRKDADLECSSFYGTRVERSDGKGKKESETSLITPVSAPPVRPSLVTHVGPKMGVHSKLV